MASVGRIEMAATTAVSFVYGLATAVQLGGMTVAFEWANYTPEPTHASLAGLVAFGLLFVFPTARRWRYYASWEKVVMVSTPVLLLVHTFASPVQDLVASSPVAGLVVWLVAVLAGAVMLR